MIINLHKVGKNKYVAKDTKNNTIGEGYIFNFMASKIYAQDRINYYIEVKADKVFNKRAIVKQLIALAVEHRAKNHPNINARVYSCLLADQRSEIEFYNSIEEFNSHEQMLVLKSDIGDIREPLSLPDGYRVKTNSLNTDNEIISFINQHALIFRSAPYTPSKIKELQELEGFNNIALYYEDTLAANILLNYEKEDNHKYGVIEDIFVAEAHRKKGLADFLISNSFSYFKNNGIEEVRLEVWSTNNRANKLYEKHGFKKLKATEVSIGFNF